MGGLARTAALVHKLANDENALLLDVARKWPTGEQGQLVAKTLALLTCDAVVCLDGDGAPALSESGWLTPDEMGTATIAGSRALLHIHGFAQAAKALSENKAHGSALQCRFERAQAPDQDAMLLVWPALPASGDDMTDVHELRVPLRLDGRYVNVIDLEREGMAWHVKCEHVPVDGSAGEDPEVKAVLDRYYRHHAQALTAESQETEALWEQRGYANAPQCAKCHEAEHRDWLAERHAHAVKTLTGRGRLVPDCLPCHSTLYRRTGKFTLDAPGADLSVECATCHGDGVLHSLLGRKDQIVKTPTEEVCRQCHRGDHDPDFDYAEAIKKVSHHEEIRGSHKGPRGSQEPTENTKRP